MYNSCRGALEDFYKPPRALAIKEWFRNASDSRLDASNDQTKFFGVESFWAERKLRITNWMLRNWIIITDRKSTKSRKPNESLLGVRSEICNQIFFLVFVLLLTESVLCVLRVLCEIFGAARNGFRFAVERSGLVWALPAARDLFDFVARDAAVCISRNWRKLILQTELMGRQEWNKSLLSPLHSTLSIRHTRRFS